MAAERGPRLRQASKERFPRKGGSEQLDGRGGRGGREHTHRTKPAERGREKKEEGKMSELDCQVPK